MAAAINPVFLIGSVPVLALALMAWRISILLSSDGVIVRNVVRSSHLIPWATVDRFVWGITSDSPKGFGHFLLYGNSGDSERGGIKLVDGTFVHAMVISASRKKPGQVPVFVEQLNEELERARHAAGLTAPPIVDPLTLRDIDPS